jgi:predicted DCC family thiol-disulfide oxidoreductase YuxK
VTIKAGDVSSDNRAIFQIKGRVSQLTSLATVMHAGLPKMPASFGYKSQRRSRIEGTEKRGRKRERERERQLRRALKRN